MTDGHLAKLDRVSDATQTPQGHHTDIKQTQHGHTPAFLTPVYAEGLEDIDPVTRSRAVVITNHQDSGDVPAMMNIVAYFEIARTTTWIIDRMFR